MRFAALSITSSLADWLLEVCRALSRLLNALCGGPAWMTFSAYSFELHHRGSRVGRTRVRVVDGLLGCGHCADAWISHRRRLPS